MTKQAQLILDEITKRYDEGYASHIWHLVQAKMESDPLMDNKAVLEVVALYQVMDEEGFSPSERGAILATLLQSVTGQRLSADAWAEIVDMPVYGTSTFSPEVKEELRRLSSSPSHL